MQLGVQSLVAPSLQIIESPSKLIQGRWLTLLRLPSHTWSKCTRETNPYVSDNLILIYPSIHMFSHLLSASVFRKDSVSGFANSQILFKTVVLGQFASELSASQLWPFSLVFFKCHLGIMASVSQGRVTPGGLTILSHWTQEHILNSMGDIKVSRRTWTRRYSAWSVFQNLLW